MINESQNENKEEEEMITRAVSGNRKPMDCEENVKKEIEKINLICMQATAHIVSMEECEAVKKIINSIEPTLLAIKNQSNNKNTFLLSKNTSSNKNIEPQRRLFKTTKIKTNTNKDSLFAKPTSREVDELALNLLQPAEIADNNIANFEEIYYS